jgi:hypothetical protein
MANVIIGEIIAYIIQGFGATFNALLAFVLGLLNIELPFFPA